MDTKIKITEVPKNYKIQTQKGSNKRLFILTQTHSMQILGEIPLSSNKTTLKQQINGQKMKGKDLLQHVLSLWHVLSLSNLMHSLHVLSLWHVLSLHGDKMCQKVHLHILSLLR